MADANKTKGGDRDPRESGVRRSSSTNIDAPHIGVSLTVAFVASMGAAVALAAIIAGILNYFSATSAASDALDAAGSTAVINLANAEDIRFEPVGNASSYRGATIQPVMVEKRGTRSPGFLYRAYRRESGRDVPVDIIIEGGIRDFQHSLVISLVASSFVVIVVGMGVAFFLSRRVVSPLTQLIEDVRKISHGDLDHRVRFGAGGEVGLLAKSVDRMIHGLRDAQDAKEVAKVREHELEIASEVRASLLPERTPELIGYEIAAHLAATDSVGGDVYDYIENVGGSGQLSVFVAGISARGVPGAMLMTMARAYLHQSLQALASPVEALKLANRPITRDMRRGLFVTTFAATLDPAAGTVRAASAGHKAPMLHFVAAEQKIKWIHPEGIALGFDPGPVFDRTVREEELQLNPGDRIVLTTSGTFSVTNESGVELGESGFADLVKKHAAKTSEAFCQLLGSEMERYRGDGALADDIVIVTIRRKGKPGSAA
ncbi:MAG: PP2C family protein-serine/threonine phosphatase [Planctomycetota bacterium]